MHLILTILISQKKRQIPLEFFILILIKQGLEISIIAVIDLDLHHTFHCEDVQTFPLRR